MEIPYKIRGSRPLREAARWAMKPVVGRRRVTGTPYVLRFPAWQHLGMLMPGGTEALEPELAKHMNAHIRPGHTVLDLGANVGFYSLLLAHLVGPGGRVHAFEPDPQSSRWLLENIRRNRLEQITPWSVALGSTDGVVDLHLDLVASRGTSVREGWDLGFDPFRRQRMRVPSARLDNLDVGLVDFVKMDVEGAELELLRGAETVLSQSRPTLLIEVIDRDQLQEVVSFLEGFDYDVADARTGAAPQPDERYSGNIIATPPPVGARA